MDAASITLLIVAVVVVTLLLKENFTWHPVLRYQLDKAMQTGVVEPANYGDSIRVADSAGPVSSFVRNPAVGMNFPRPGGYSGGYAGGYSTVGGTGYQTGGYQTPPAVEANFLAQFPMKVPVPVGALKNTFIQSLPTIDRGWRKVGIMTRGGDIMNLYARPVVPAQDLWEYKCRDRDGFSIPLMETFIDDGDIVKRIPGKDGEWKVTTFTSRRYEWV